MRSMRGAGSGFVKDLNTDAVTTFDDLLKADPSYASADKVLYESVGPQTGRTSGG